MTAIHWSRPLVPAGRGATRAAAALVFLLLVHPARLEAQDAAFTVSAATADVHKGPSTASPVVGHARRGAVLAVSRDLGSWVKVSWPDAADGVGYVHVSTGSRSGAPAPVWSGSTSLSPPSNGLAPAPGQPAGASLADEAALAQPVYLAPPRHVIGLGVRTGGANFGSGLSARTWFHDRVGVQFEVSRSALTSPVTSAHVTAVQFGPSLIVALPDRITEDVVVRPYFGAGPRLFRQSIAAGPQGASTSESRKGVQAFGGGEVTFAAAPQFTLSLDLRYGWSELLPAGYELGGLGFSLAGHWYVK